MEELNIILNNEDYSKLTEFITNFKDKKLYLGGGWNLCDKAIKAIANGLKQNNTLKLLDLTETGITDNTVIYLIEMLKYNKKLETLNLSFNEISDEGGKKLFESIELYNSTIIDLKMFYNNTSHMMNFELHGLMWRNKGNKFKKELTLQQRCWMIINHDKELKEQLEQSYIDIYENNREFKKLIRLYYEYMEP